MDALPEELLTYIFEHLLTWNLTSVIPVCRRFARVATPLVYKQLIFQESDQTRFMRSQAQLLRTLLDRPDLAQSVDYLAFGWWYSDERTTADLGDLMSTFSAAALRYEGTMFYPEMVMELEERSSDALVALLLNRLPNLKTLRLGLVPFDDDVETDVDHNRTLTFRTVEAAIARPFSGPDGVLSALTYVILDGSPSFNEEELRMEWDARIISLLLRLSTLNKLVATNARCTGTIKGWACTPKYSNVKHIEIWNSNLGLEEKRSAPVKH